MKKNLSSKTMEALLSSGGPQSDVLVGPLKFGLDPQGSYCQGRRSSTCFSNVDYASPAGVKQITINVGSSSEWLDPSTVLVSFLIKNTDTTNALFPATPSAVQHRNVKKNLSSKWKRS